MDSNQFMYQDLLLQTKESVTKRFNDSLGELKELFHRTGRFDDANTKLDEITCTNATNSVPVLFMQYSNKTEMFIDKGCIHVEFDTPVSLIAQGEKIIYLLLGVLK